MISNSTHLAEINSPRQKIQASVELYKGSTLQTTCTCGDVLSDFAVERVGEGKFFGFGIVHTLKVSLIDINREITINPDYTIRVAYIVNDSKVYPYPTFHIKPDGIERDETSNTITISAYDSLGKATEHTFSELNLTPPYTYVQVATACKSLLGIGTLSTNNNDGFNTSFAEGANFEGTEKIRDVLNAIAEATQTVYHVKAYGVSGTLRFKRINKDAAVDYEIGRNKYFSLKTTGAAVLSNICHATELGDNVISTSTTEGVTQYVRNNPFWETISMSEDGDIGATVDAAATKMSGTSIAQFESEWAGNYLLEPIDKITLEAEDGSSITAYILDDVIHYDGTLSETTRWQYAENDAETDSNPSNLGDALKQTYARVDKANKQIELVVNEQSTYNNRLSILEVNTQGISATVSEVKTSTEEAVGAINENFETLSKQVSAKVDAESFEVSVKEIVKETGVDEVETSTGFTFNKDGLNISKSDSEMTTQITEDGMTIKRSGQETLVADSSGVKAENLHATTYLIIGNTSRFEDFGSDRTGCFWIGG